MALELNINDFKLMKTEILRFMLSYKFAIEEVSTKINILMQEFQYIHDHNPIEHVKSRLKSPESIINKVQRKGYPLTIKDIRDNIHDIAGIRITCSYISDIYKVSEMIQKQKDIEVIQIKDYIENPKPNGYRSLHLIIKIPIFMSDHVEDVYVELQIRTIAMDFWASLEHKIFYKYNKEIPQHMKDELKEAAETAAQLDVKMEKLQREMLEIKGKELEALPNLFESPKQLESLYGFLNNGLK
ncbi:GTP pyrophosphokinase [Ornithinibacillus bavariensis]|uniref:GTP pyrophosphokinase n=1 Tax=Ornithinibacillus bavariensis TaxID=545502 RepID=UPI000ED4F91A|nr:GTP pyrophosphokinase [Ornithinibacillus sp.]